MNEKLVQFLEQDETPAAAVVSDPSAAKTTTATAAPIVLEQEGPDSDVVDRILSNDAGGESDDRANRLLDILASRKFNYAKPPPPVREVYSCAGVPIATPSNLVTITAQAKSGKSAIVGAMLAAAMTEDSTADCLGFAAANPDGLAIVHIDTEQSPYDHWALLARSIKRAYLEDAPEWLQSVCLTGLSVSDSIAALELLLVQAAEKFRGIHSVFLDGTADLCSNVNDPEEANLLVARLHALAIRYDCPIVNVLHLNPGSAEKSRGHLGSQLERKSETNLVVEKALDVSQVSSTKQRRAPILPGQGPRFRWSEEKRMHVSTSESLPVVSKPKKATAPAVAVEQPF